MPGNAPAAAAATLSRALCARRVLDMGSTTLRHSWFLSRQHLTCAARRFRSADDIVPRALTSRLDSVGALTHTRRAPCASRARHGVRPRYAPRRAKPPAADLSRSSDSGRPATVPRALTSRGVGERLTVAARRPSADNRGRALHRAHEPDRCTTAPRRARDNLIVSAWRGAARLDAERRAFTVTDSPRPLSRTRSGDKSRNTPTSKIACRQRTSSRATTSRCRSLVRCTRTRTRDRGERA